MKIDATIGLKKGVTDAEGASTAKALRLLGFSSVKGVSSMKTFRIDIDAKNEDAAVRAVEKMCSKLLANPVIQEYSIKVVR
jgi:phosphoribosylformylglycinamidine synthase